MNFCYFMGSLQYESERIYTKNSENNCDFNIIILISITMIAMLSWYILLQRHFCFIALYID